MNYICLTAAFAGVAWTFYLIGQYTGLKETNRRLAALASERDGWKQEARGWRDILDKTNEERDEHKAFVEHWIAEADRLSDLVATLQAKVPTRNARGKFVAR